MKKVIITIGREYGSGGRYIGEMVSNKLNIPFYDKEFIFEANWFMSDGANKRIE